MISKCPLFYIWFYIFLLFIGFLSSLLSFYPNITNTYFLSNITKVFFYLAEFPKQPNKNNKPIDNLKEIKSFYGDIAQNYDDSEYEKYLKNLYVDYFSSEKVNKTDMPIFSILDKEYGKEIIILSKITVQKYKFFKLTLKSLILFITIFIIVLGTNKIFEKEYYIVISNNSIIRETPSTKGVNLFKLNKNTCVEKIGSHNEWLNIKVNEQEGWIHKSLIEKK